MKDDPFAAADSDRTIMVPRPGGRATSRPQTASPLMNEAISCDAAVPIAGMNPLVAAANPLLVLVPQIRATLQHPDPAGLRDYLAQNIKAFEARTRSAGVSSEKITAARYALCTLLDEVAASTPWGGSGIWAKHSLLVMFHNETWGGEKFFQLLAKLADAPPENRDLLELMYVCLALGFEGRYRVIDNGKAQLDALSERLAQLLRKQHGEYERDLSPHWRGVSVKRSPLLNALPLWAALAIAAVALLGAYLGFNYALNNASDPVFAQIQAIRAKAPAAQAPAPASQPRLAPFLAKEIKEELVTVREEKNRSTVILRGDGLFQPASATVSPSFVPLLTRVAEALNSVPGQVVVTGHTDNQPIRTARFPSNWHLSKERARSVSNLLAQKVMPQTRLSAEGKADAEPVAANDSAAGRARNRRVEITLLVPPGS